MLRRFVIIAVAASSFALAACNTVEGVGRDVESAGETVADAAK